jgi:hypothetical protein
MLYDRVVRKIAWGALFLLCGCRGSVPALYQPPEAGIASVLIGCRMVLPTGETPDGVLWLNFEDQDGGETYRLPVKPQRVFLYQVEPGVYKVGPTRSIFGFHQETLRVVIEGRSYRVPFPRELLRLETYSVKPRKIVSIGIVEVTLSGRRPGQAPTVKVRLDDSATARRSLAEAMIHAMMDSNAPNEMRSSALAWTRALEETLSEVVTEKERSPMFRPAP